ncbi:MAG: glycoside hydrolase family 3 C-terminal domain-containing protein, partial [Proteobacteria bacterium]|nr:glycoside hydrolase family 3 C-terminal domain-containing protein [Pseudomonadota bacterium]
MGRVSQCHGKGKHPLVLRRDVVTLSKLADLVVVGIGSEQFMHEQRREREGKDQPFALDRKQYGLINSIRTRNKNVVVVVLTGTGIHMAPFADRVPAIVQAFFPGEHGGKPIAEVLLGKVSPSGKLPFTLGRRPEDHHWFGNYLPDGAQLYELSRYGRGSQETEWKAHYREG